MKTIGQSLLKIGFSIFLLAIAFWPQYGAAWYIGKNFMDMPEVFVVAIALWVGALALNLPLSLKRFRQTTTASIVVLFGVAIYAMAARGYFAIDNINSWAISAIFMVGVLIGWWTVSVPLWRWYRNTLPTDEQDLPE
jgi:hypothetical protein